MTKDLTSLRWAELAAAIRAAREARGLSQEALAVLASISEGTVQNLEGGKPRSRMPQSLAKVEPHIGWESGSGRTILEGGKPTLTPEPSEQFSANLADDKLRRKLPLRIVGELESNDPLLDSTVIQLPGIDGARMTIVVHGKPDATPEEIQAALLEWRRMEQHLRRLPDDDGDGSKAANGS